MYGFNINDVVFLLMEATIERIKRLGIVFDCETISPKLIEKTILQVSAKSVESNLCNHFLPDFETCMNSYYILKIICLKISVFEFSAEKCIKRCKFSYFHSHKFVVKSILLSLQEISDCTKPS